MQRLNKVLLTIALALGAGAVMATGNLSVSISEGEGAEAHVRVTNAVESQFEMEIRNGNNDIIYYKQIQQPLKLVLNTFDFSKLSNGQYTFFVKIDNEQNVSTLAVKNGKVKVIDQVKQVDPYFGLFNDQLNISYLNHGAGDVKLFLYDEQNNNLIHEDLLGSEFAVHHAIDLSNLKNGSYEAVLVSSNGTYEYDITLN
ncbi:hypothetical protein SAMN05444285_12223 [Draconibacterium orientale]|uniref:Por secretion system C-terminal sorting domain-containing protein n=1 Tax=Draconibacterium orientale TaxID=1168034 RepID=X5DMS4_9BACT|nr:hypothetical protein [Draconibacterium orientale]AHW61892.1 hypothetical protein FH5T_10490 [Draconibacterium orientale]SET75441.1 hypothetical protein SAMN05444285_12223 [Draconibacterium orientale]